MGYNNLIDQQIGLIMYSFAPIPTEQINHVGFFLVTFPAVLVWLSALYHAKEEELSVVLITLILGVVIGFVYCVSYVWTNQEPKAYANTKVVGTLIGFVAEGHRESRSSGKTTTVVDVHNTYVEYEVSGQRILSPAQLGQTYPQQAILYKN
jgi:hypothetical protein